MVVAAGTLLVLLLLVFLLTLFFLFQRRQHQSLQEKAALHALYSNEILQTQVEVQNSTLQKISEELHDNIGQLLLVAKINLNLLEQTRQNLQNQERITQANEIIGLSINELRALTKSFDGDFVKDFGLVESLSQELIRIRRTNQYFTSLDVTGQRISLGYEREIVLFRILQEVISNVIKHAQAKNIQMVLRYQPEKLFICVQDDGIGFENESLKVGKLSLSGSGLRNMKRRAVLIGGELRIQTEPGCGTSIELEIPVSKPF